MLRKWAVTFLFAIMAAFAARAQDYVNTKDGYRATIPPGWSQRKESVDDFVVVSPATETTFGYCFAHSVPMPITQTVSQAELDLRLAGKFTPEYWKASFEPELRNVVVESSGEKIQNGRKTYYAVVTYMQIRRPHRFKTVVHFLPGRSYHLTCNAYVETYAREQAAFETFFNSFVPIDMATKE